MIEAGSDVLRGVSRRATLLLPVLAGPAAARPDPRAMAVADWAETAEQLTEGPNWRTRTIMHLAMHDALNGVAPRFARYAPATPREPDAAGAAPEAALSAAAYHVLAALHPNARPLLEQRFRSALAGVADGAPRERGIAVGRAIAATLVEQRNGDGDGPPLEYQASDQPGLWRPTPPHYSPGGLARLGDLKPFALASATQFPLPGPPPLGSAQDIADLEEVRRVGAADSILRTAGQTAAAHFWAGHHGTRQAVLVAAQLLRAAPPEGGLHGAAWLMAVLNLAITDVNIATFDAKKRIARWRPITALRAGMPGLPADPNWNSLVITPPHPEYPAGHTVVAWAFATVLRRAYGGERAFDYVVTEAGVEKDRRRFQGFSAMAEECSESRIWAGVHVRTTNVHSRALSETVATWVLANRLAG